MFDLPHSEQIDEELDVSPGMIQPFENGYITTWVGRRKTPYGHRLVRAGRIVGWLCEGDSSTKLLGGGDARTALETAEEGTHRLVAYACSLRGLGSLATLPQKRSNSKPTLKAFHPAHPSQIAFSLEIFLQFFPPLKDTTMFEERLQRTKEFSSIVLALCQVQLKSWLQASRLFLIQ